MTNGGANKAAPASAGAAFAFAGLMQRAALVQVGFHDVVTDREAVAGVERAAAGRRPEDGAIDALLATEGERSVQEALADA